MEKYIGITSYMYSVRIPPIEPRLLPYGGPPAPPGPFQPAYPGEGFPPPVAAYDPYDPYGAPLAGSLDRFKIWNAHGKDHPFKKRSSFFRGLKGQEISRTSAN